MFAPHQPPPLPSLGWRWRQLKFTIVIKLLLCLRVFYLEWVQTAKYTLHCHYPAICSPPARAGNTELLGCDNSLYSGRSSRAAAGGDSTAPRGPGTIIMMPFIVSWERGDTIPSNEHSKYPGHLRSFH